MSSKREIIQFILVSLLAFVLISFTACTISEKKSGGEKASVETTEDAIRSAEYVGSTKCLSCHGDKVNWGKTLHKVTLRAPLSYSPLQEKAETFYAGSINRGMLLSLGSSFSVSGYPSGVDDSETPDDGEAVVYYYDSSSGKWKTHFELGLGGTAVASLPATSGSYTKMYAAYIVYNSSDGRFYVKFENLTGTSETAMYPIILTYGGEGLYKQRFVVEIGASKYISPLQYNDNWREFDSDPVNAMKVKWVNYHGDKWFDPGTNSLKTPAAKDAFDGNCAGCHFTGYTIQNINGYEVADAVDDPNGAVDFDGDGTMDEVNIGCEACHGPGSRHVETLNPAYIINPDDLTPAQADMICAQCHVRGKSKDQFDVFAEGTASAPFPAKLDSDGLLQKYVVGFDDISDYYVWDSGSGTYDGQYWGGEPSGGTFLASYKHHQQYIDLLQGPHAPDKPYDSRCFDCHEMHDNRSPGSHQIATSITEDGVAIKTDNDDDSLCLACHAGYGPFADLTKEEVRDYSLGLPSDNLKSIVVAHTKHAFDPEGSGASRCSKCHMPKTAKSAMWTFVDFGDSGTGNVTIEIGDIHSHTMEPIEPKYSKTTGPTVGSDTKHINSSCVGCHQPGDTRIDPTGSLTGDDFLDALQEAYEDKFGTHNTAAVQGASYVGSDACQSCHDAIYSDFMNSGHPYKLTFVGGDGTSGSGTAPTYPTFVDWGAGFDFANMVVDSGLTAPSSFDDVSYVIGGYGWKVRFMNVDGYIITGDGVQWNLPNPGYTGEQSWVAYHSGENGKEYNCGKCHTTGYSDSKTPPNGALPGIVGGWEFEGIQCEECHGPGSVHVTTANDPNSTEEEIVNSIVYNADSSLCGRCHTRDSQNRIAASGGFIKHHEQYDELLGINPDDSTLAWNGEHAKNGIGCNTCHDPHKTVIYAEALGFSPEKIECEACHANKVGAFVQSAHASLECEDCHMPYLVKSAVKKAAVGSGPEQGDIRSHIFKIDLSKTDQFTGDGSFAYPWLTARYACDWCHNGVDVAVRSGSGPVHTQ